jgi:DNA-binding transcriptional LysR family regulator
MSLVELAAGREVPVELRVLRYFLAVAESGSTVAAAEAMLTSQPSLLRQVRGLEGELGIALFEPGRGRLRLTTAGRQVVALAHEVVSRADDIQRLAIEATNAVPLTVVAPLTFIVDVLAPYLAEPEAAGTVVYPREVPPNAVVHELASGEVDLAVASWPVPERYATRMLTRPQLWAYVPPGHRLARRRTVEAADLSEERLIVLAQEHGTRRIFDEAMLAAGISWEPHLVTNLPVVALALAAAGHGVAVVTDEPQFGLHRAALREGRSAVRLSMLAAWDPRRLSAPAVERFVDAFAAYCRRTRPA